MLIRFFGPCVLLVFLMFPSTSMSAPVSITVDNFTQFHQLEDTRFACYFDSGRQKSQLGKVNGNTLQESTAFRKLKFGKERKKLADKIKKQKAALKRAKGKSQRVRSNRARGSGNSKVTKLRQKLSETKALLKLFKQYRKFCKTFTPTLCENCVECSKFCNSQDPDPSPSPTSTPFDPNAPDPFDAPYLWFPITFDNAINLGNTIEPIPDAERQDAGQIQLTDVTVAAGLGAAVGGGNQHGVGVAFVDLTGDRWEDILVVNGTNFDSSLWRNNRDGTFTDISAASGIDAILNNGVDGYSVAAADYDLDGDVDLYIGAHPGDLLLQNQGNSTFVNVTSGAGAGGPATSQSGTGSKVVSFGDFSGDGIPDIVSASSDIPGPGLYLLRNNANGTFTDVTAGSGTAIHPSGNPCAVLWSDFDNDADVDLHIWNDRGGKVLLRNESGNGFVDITDASLLNDFSIGNPMGIDTADINHDGFLDYYVSNIGNNPLLLNNGNSTFTNITQSAGTGGDFGWGLGFEDFNSDTWADIFVAQEDNLPFIVFKNLGQNPVSFSRRNFNHINVQNTGQAHNVAVAFADYDHDGRVDVVTATTDGTRITLFKNTTSLGTNRWLEVTVSLAGARPPIGARVVVKTGGLVQYRDILGGSSRSSQNALSARFGLGQWNGAEWVAVMFPTGELIVKTGVLGNLRTDMFFPF